MIEELGTVAEVKSGKALVATRRSGACESCSAKAGCQTLGGGRDARVWVTDPLGVVPGDNVVIAVSEGALLKASLMVYIAPVVMLLVGALLGSFFSPALGVSEDLGALLFGVLFMVLTFVVVKARGGSSIEGPRIIRKEPVDV